mgnify:CR=1 FL=1
MTEAPDAETAIRLIGEEFFGVVITAVHEATGNNFEAVTDDVGKYRMSVRIGVYRMTADLQGFASLTRTGVALLVGQQVTVNLEMAPATLQ